MEGSERWSERDGERSGSGGVGRLVSVVRPAWDVRGFCCRGAAVAVLEEPGRGRGREDRCPHVPCKTVSLFCV